ncbi:hypothetical protein V1527DRAFT_452484 [Lipomyces starkeyi]
MATRTLLSHDDDTVGWICALPLEMAAAKAMMDEVYEDLPVQPNDHNAYILGRIGNHNIVIACLPRVNMALHQPPRDAGIRLGDVVVSRPTNVHGGVVQYDYGKALSGGGFQPTGMLNRPPQILLTALAKLQASHLTEGSQAMDFLDGIKHKIPRQASNFTRPTQEDHLYLTDYDHVEVNSKTCSGCDPTKIVPRASRNHSEPVVHYGLIASGNRAVKDSQLRDKLGRELGVYCVEMEAAGLMNNYPCLVVRGICDYADSHKNKGWQGYASATAAAYAKELLLCTSVSHVDQARTARNTLSDSASRFHVPLDLTAVPAIGNFLGRYKELERLWHHLQPEHSNSRKVVILHGLGGMGKTQLAIHFARDHKEDFNAIFWLSVFELCPTQITRPIPDHQNEEEVEQNARQVLKWLAKQGNSRWLVIFDNVDQYSPVAGDPGDGYDLSEFFPTADHGSILITSRLQRLTELGKSFPVQKLESEDAIQLLLQSSRLSVQNTIGKEEVDQDITALTDRLGGLPLAIVIAGAFMRETGTSISEYLQYYQKSWHDLQSHSRPGRHYQHEKQDQNAAELLLLLAHFDYRDIWYELVKCGTNSSNQPTWFSNVTPNRFAFKERMRTLIGFSFIEVKQQEGSYAMHPVVQDWCLHMTENDAKTNRRNELALVSVGYMVPDRSDQNYWELQGRLLPHADYVLQAWDSDWLADDTAIWSAFHGLGNLYSDQGKLKEAEEMCERALAGREKALGPDHTSTLVSVHNLGNLYSDQGKLKEAEEMYERALAGREKALGPDHTSTLVSGKLKEAEEMYERALAGREKALGLNHPKTQ